MARIIPLNGFAVIENSLTCGPARIAVMLPRRLIRVTMLATPRVSSSIRGLAAVVVPAVAILVARTIPSAHTDLRQLTNR